MKRTAMIVAASCALVLGCTTMTPQEQGTVTGAAIGAAAGAGIALSHDAPVVVAVLMGVVAGTTGGVLRDIVVNELPDLFRPGALYATASLAGAIVFVGCLWERVDYTAAAIISAAIVVILRLLSVRLGVRMPSPQWGDDHEHRRA